LINIKIPGRAKVLALAHLVLDFNGTIALNGILLPGVKEKLNDLSEKLEIHILTADTFGTSQEACQQINGRVVVLQQNKECAILKKEFIEALGKEKVVSIGNGTNDTLMLKNSALGIAVLGPEGTSLKAIQSAGVIVTDINHGLDLLLNPQRLIATLRE